MGGRDDLPQRRNPRRRAFPQRRTPHRILPAHAGRQGQALQKESITREAHVPLLYLRAYQRQTNLPDTHHTRGGIHRVERPQHHRSAGTRHRSRATLRGVAAQVLHPRDLPADERRGGHHHGRGVRRTERTVGEGVQRRQLLREHQRDEHVVRGTAAEGRAAAGMRRGGSQISQISQILF